MPHLSNCLNKKRYETKPEAGAAADGLNAYLSRKSVRNGSNKPYRCPFCDGYHIGRNRNYRKAGCR
ncbi:MAG: hypothetical protein P1V36_17970 [Planctomycetota bacterium]|nr:hypothetical protein [Planctomycetota bacterium]